MTAAPSTPTPAAPAIPTDTTEPINARLLAVSEDRIAGFHRAPFAEIARLSELDEVVVCERIRALLRAGTIRRVRQTLLANNLAEGALVAWQLPPERLDAAFDALFKDDPFSGHVVVRSTDTVTAGSNYRLWTTLKVPQGYSMERHAQFWARRLGAEHFRLMSAKCLFALGVGHVRRRGLEPGARADAPADVMHIAKIEITELEWQVLTALKRELTPEEVGPGLWEARAAAAGVPVETFFTVAEDLNRRKIIGRFSTFLEHVKQLTGGERVTRFNGLFHWAVPPGREIDAGREVGRHHVITHAYWREGGPEFNHVNVMAVAHGMEKEPLLAHKAAIDAHLAEAGIPVAYTNVFWGGRSEIKPSEISPIAYREWCAAVGLDPERMRGE
ncbi:MAG: Lrp/AsnC family transcriptional regulator [Planctomycetes bacterium]|nr:Lrp/AsnC family transcriptional regulator [Planctomycetota bacterium]